MPEGKAHSMEVTQVDFALHFLKKHEETLIISPLSISAALAMAYAGADGDTKEEMRSVLAGGNSDADLHAYFTSIVQSKDRKSDEMAIEMASKIYVQKGFQVLDDFIAFIENNYGGNFDSIDFSDAIKAAEIMNSWVAKITHNCIETVIEPSVINSLTRMILINAAYFKGAWKTKFSPERTSDELFYVSENVEREVKMMVSKSSYRYTENDTAQVVCLPYSADGVVMYIMLPKERYGLQEFVGRSDGSQLLALMDGCHATEVEVRIPKFKAETSLELTKNLKDAGVNSAFDDSADFSKITGDQMLKISDVLHKSFIEVDENGTEAAAASAVVMRTRRAVPVAPPMFPIFHANHGFIYFIVDNATRAVLFAGSYC